MKDRWGLDWDATAKDYAQFRTGYGELFFAEMAQRDLGKPGQSVVDLATGPGTLARGFAKRGCVTTGVDIAGELIEQAKLLDKTAKVNTRYVLAPAENTGLPDSCADIVCSGNSWSWFDGPAALREVLRLLKPDGRLLVTYSNVDAQPGNVVEASFQFEEKYGGPDIRARAPGQFKDWIANFKQAGLNVSTFMIMHTQLYTHEHWRGFMRANQRTGAGLSVEEVRRFDERFAAMLKERFPQTELEVPIYIPGVIATRHA